MLEDGERLEADNGYMGECPCKCPNGVSRRKDRMKMNQQQRNRSKTINYRFKNWGCMKQGFRHSVSKHRVTFQCVAILTQLAIEHGEEMFPIVYDDRLNDRDVGL